jgi:hypothetical protein
MSTISTNFIIEAAGNMLLIYVAFVIFELLVIFVNAEIYVRLFL